MSSATSPAELFAPAGPWRALVDEANRDHVRGLATFLQREADLLDRGELGAWLALFSDDCVYWVPAVHDAADPRGAVNLIYDSHELLDDRVFRLMTGQVPSQDPPSRTVRVLGAIAVAASVQPDALLARTNFVLFELRRGAGETYAGTYTYLARRQGADWRLRGKRVQLLNSDQPLPSLTFLL
jgi:benzoate/toluate 1,2-dioxygenase beta subunit